MASRPSLYAVTPRTVTVTKRNGSDESSKSQQEGLRQHWCLPLKQRHLALAPTLQATARHNSHLQPLHLQSKQKVDNLLDFVQNEQTSIQQVYKYYGSITVQSDQRSRKIRASKSTFTGQSYGIHTFQCFDCLSGLQCLGRLN